MGFWHNMDVQWEENYIALKEKQENKKKLRELNVPVEKKHVWIKLKIKQFFIIHMTGTLILILIYLGKVKGWW